MNKLVSSCIIYGAMVSLINYNEIVTEKYCEKHIGCNYQEHTVENDFTSAMKNFSSSGHLAVSAATLDMSTSDWGRSFNISANIDDEFYGE